MVIPTEPIGSIPRPLQRAERELVAATQALSESNERLQFALDAGHLGTWNWDAATDQLTLGPRAAQMFGMPAEIPVTRARMREMLHPEDAPRAREALDRALAERTDYSVEYRVNRPTGGQSWIAASGRGRYAQDGRVLGMTGVMQDITERKREEQALREADARKDKFLATLAHELRNPLAPVRMSLEILRQEGLSREAEENARAVILRQVAQMVALIDDLSEFVLRRKAVPGVQADPLPDGRPDKPPVGRRRRVLVVDDNLDHAESLAILLRLDGHEAHTAYDGLAAIDAVSAVHPEVVLLDIGMPGLNGYETARRIRELDSTGNITLIAISGWGRPKDRLLSQESGFDHHLLKPVDPAELRGLVAEERRRTQAQGRPPLRVLLADDNPALQESLTYLLQGAGCEIRAAPDGVEAVNVAKNWRPDVVFVDIHMPRLNGFQVAKQLREQFSPGAMKLILMSGVSIDETLKKDAKQAGFDACIDKVAEPDLWLRHLNPAVAG